MNRPLRLLALASCAAAAVWLLAGRGPAAASEDLAVSEGPIKILTLPLEGPTAGKLYFEITPREAGAPSAFKVDVNNWAAIEVLTAARASQSAIRITYKPDFTVTELEVLEPPRAPAKPARSRR
jgi:hypothetical protein